MESYLRRCLDCLLVNENLLPKLEVLVINDGSKDASSAIAHEYEEKYPQVFRVIDKINGNYGSCINRGLKEATGKYLKVLDADDCFDTNGLQELIEFLETCQVDLVVTKFSTQDSRNDSVCVSDYSDSFKDKEEQTFDNVSHSSYFKNIVMHSMTYRRAIFSQIDYVQTEGVSYTDNQWAFVPLTQVRTLSYLPVVVYHYYLGREGQTMDPKVLRKTQGQRVKMCLGLVPYYEALYPSLSKLHAQVFEHQTFCVIKDIYYNGLFEGVISHQELQAFDKALSSFPLCYERTSTMTIGASPIKFVEAFRKHQVVALWLAKILYKVRSVSKRLKDR